MSLKHTPITDELADYVRRVTLREPEVLRRLRQEAEGHPNGSLQIGPEQGQFLHLLARILGARRTLEVGVFWGYSSTWVALALPPGGKLVACDCNTEYATRKYELAVESVKRGAPREGDHWTDGTPANKKTEVFPCKVVWTRVTTYTGGDAKVVKERFTGEYVFFLDEFGEWTFKIKKQTTETF